MPLKGRLDFRSDTFTEPTAAMRHAMATCDVGDDVWELDNTVKELEAFAACIFGKESALFVPSSCMANLIAVMAHCSGRGEEILVGDRSHISLYEQGNVSTIGGVHVRTLKNFDDGTFCLKELGLKKRPANNVHFPKTSLVCIETSHNMCGGSAVKKSFIDEVRREIGDGVRIHVDGARIFNSITALGITPSEYTESVDSIAVCLSKGLAAPVGAVLIGSSSFMRKAKMLRKALGGGMRQAGVIACCGQIALRDMVGRLYEDHDNARLLYLKISSIPGIIISEPATNIVKFSLDESVFKDVDLSGLTSELQKRNVWMITVDEGRAVRAVTHLHVSSDDVARAGSILQEVLSEVISGTLSIAPSERLY